MFLAKSTHLLHSSACDYVTIPRRTPGYPPGGRHDNATTSAVHSVQDECTDPSCLLHAHACVQATRLGPTLPLATRQQVVTSTLQIKSNINCYEAVHVVRTWRPQLRAPCAGYPPPYPGAPPPGKPRPGFSSSWPPHFPVLPVRPAQVISPP